MRFGKPPLAWLKIAWPQPALNRLGQSKNRETSGKYMKADQVPTRWKISTSGLCLEVRTSSNECRSFAYILTLKECNIVPHARGTQCAIFLIDETIQAQHKTEWRARHSGGSARWQAPHRRQKIPMITQPIPHIEAQPTLPDVQHRPHLHFPGQPHLRPAPQSIGATGTRPLNIALAGLQLLIGYEWLLAGGDKLLLGAFPAQLGGMLFTLGSGGHLVSFFAALLQVLLAPHTVLCGALIRGGETPPLLGLVASRP